MNQLRQIAATFRSRPTVEGAGVRLKRAFGYHHAPQFDPFLMLDDFHTADPAEYLAGFPWHPHRGIETITYVLEGVVEHGDSLGNQGVIGAGDVQWMTAGSGIVHQEMPRKSPTGLMWGLQFWANLPTSHKMMPPRYRDVKAADIPVATLDTGARVKVISGCVQGVTGPVRDIVSDPEMLDVSLPAGTAFVHAVKPGHALFAYVLDGVGSFGTPTGPSENVEGSGEPVWGPETVVLYDPAGDAARIAAGDRPLRFLLLSGRPLNEPVAWRGPIVMNTDEELDTAFEEYRNGTFLRHRG